MELKLPGRKNRKEALARFAETLKEISGQVGFKISSRGWCYQLEGFQLITKARFDLVENIVNECRAKGYLPIDFTAEEEARKFSGVEIPEDISPVEFMKQYLEATLRCENWYTPDWWQGEEYYIQMVVEKIDIKTLFTPVCRRYHIPIATCFDAETEILTRDGWKKFLDLTNSDKVATMNRNGELVYCKPTRIINEPYEGSMYYIKNRATDQMLKPNHQSYVKRQRNRKENERFELTPISEVAHLQNLRFRKDIKWVGVERQYFRLPPILSNGGSNVTKSKLEMDVWLQFLGYYLSEGSTTKKKNHVYRVQLAQKNPVIQQKMANCVRNLGYNFYKDYQSIQISNKQLYAYLNRLGKAHEKYIPREFLELSPRQLRILLDALIDGDGHRREGRMVSVTSSKRLADDIQELALKASYYASVSLKEKVGTKGGVIHGREIITKHQTYAVNICSARKEFRINHGKKDWELVSYSGNVHCVEVPTGIIYVRRNGKPVWSGNSRGWSSMLQRAEYAQRFKEAEKRGLKCVLLYCGDHDPDGLRISEFLRKNLRDLKDVLWSNGTRGYDPSGLIIDRFGLNYDFIIANNLTWIDNLITGSKKNLADPSHPNYHQTYVQDYLAKIGVRKCEANALVVRPREAAELCRNAIEKYLGPGALERFKDKREVVRREAGEFRKRTGLNVVVEKALKLMENEGG